MIITWYNTAALSVQTKNNSVLFDPFLPLKGSRVLTAPSDYDGFFDIFLTHAHLDHIVSLPLLCRRQSRRLFGTQAVQTALAELGVEKSAVEVIRSGDEKQVGDILVKAFHGKHVRYDGKTLYHTFCNVRMFRYAYNIPPILRENRICQENGETTAYLVRAEGKSVFILGSLNLLPDAIYPTDVDLIVLPYQGTSDLLTPALEIIDRIRPKAVLLDHFDDTFPPLSRTIDTGDIERALRNKLPLHKLENGGKLEL